MTTVKDILDRNKGIGPGFHLLRHVLAFFILLWHARQAIWWSYSAKLLAANGEIPRGLSRVSNFSLEDIARPAIHSLVGIFFILSGFLVMGSALRTRNTGKFLLNRALRIFPALGAETLLSAFILGPIATSLTLGAYFTNPEFFVYFGNMVGWLHYTLPGVFEHNPLPRTINGQLWTLHPEFFSYFSMALLMLLSVVYKRRVLLIAFCAVMVTVLALYLYDPVRFDVKGEDYFFNWYIALLFWFGVVTYAYAEYVPLHFGYFILAGAAYWLMMSFNVLTPLTGIPLTYIMVYVGMTSFAWWDRLVESDYSYGIYLYHFPIIQLIMWLFTMSPLIKLGLVTQLLLLVPSALVVTVGFAMLSWRFIEKPALKLRTVFARTKAITEPAPVAA